jgi:hypothetical protein
MTVTENEPNLISGMAMELGTVLLFGIEIVEINIYKECKKRKCRM